MALSEKQKKHLRRLAHPMSPVVMLGNAGLTDGVVSELDRALNDREARNEALATLATRTLSEVVQRVGNVGVFYRRSKELPKILLPD
jgi:RNA-binding protein